MQNSTSVMRDFSSKKHSDILPYHPLSLFLTPLSLFLLSPFLFLSFFLFVDHSYTKDLIIGDVVNIKQGDILPADGVIIEGSIFLSPPR